MWYRTFKFGLVWNHGRESSLGCEEHTQRLKIGTKAKTGICSNDQPVLVAVSRYLLTENGGMREMSIPEISSRKV